MAKMQEAYPCPQTIHTKETSGESLVIYEKRADNGFNLLLIINK
jgi:hypothetical protein